MPRNHIARIRKICLALPEATEVEAWGEPSFRVGKMFAMYASSDTHHGSGREGIWVKTDHFTQDLLVRGQPARYFKPPYVGPQGWTGAYLDGNTDWIALTVLLRDAWRSTAPRKVAALLPDSEDEASAPASRSAAVAKKTRGKASQKSARTPGTKRAAKAATKSASRTTTKKSGMRSTAKAAGKQTAKAARKQTAKAARKPGGKGARKRR